MEIIEIIKMELKGEISSSSLSPDICHSREADWQCIVDSHSFNMHFKTTFFFPQEAITEDDDFYLDPDTFHFCRVIEYLQTWLRGIKEF